MDAFLFGTVGSPISTPAKPGGSVGAIQTISLKGLSALELGWVQAIRVSPETCKNIKMEAAAQNVKISVHAPYFINLNATPEEWIKSRQRLWDAAYYGNLAGATDIIFHPGSYFEKEPDEVLPIAVQRLNKLVDDLHHENVQVTLRPETMGKAALLGSFQDTLIMAKEVPGVLPCLDFAHLHARIGNGSMNTYPEWMALLEEYGRSLGDDLLQKLHIHLSGIEYSPKGEKNHLPLQESDLNLKDLFRALIDTKSSGRILCESPILEEDAIYMRDLWKTMNS